MLIIPLCDIMTLTEDWIQSEKLKQKKEFHSTCQIYDTRMEYNGIITIRHADFVIGFNKKKDF